MSNPDCTAGCGFICTCGDIDYSRENELAEETTRLRQQLDIAVGALAHSRACLELANTEGLIFDTIWAGDAETLFDYMDSALAQIRERSDV